MKDENYLYLLDLFQKNKQRYLVTINAYCLMPNHYHLLLYQDNDKSISRFLKSTFQSYAQAFNKKYDRTGKLFEGNPQGKLIDDESYLTHLCRYIHLNPVDAGIVDDNELWPYSNYFEFIDKRNGTLYEPEFIKEYFSDVGYQQFVLDYIHEKQKYREIGKYLFEE